VLLLANTISKLVCFSSAGKTLVKLPLIKLTVETTTAPAMSQKKEKSEMSVAIGQWDRALV
jgi:hypothetical protein